MKSNKSPLHKLTQYLSVLPLALLLITANAAYAQTNESKKEITSRQDPQKKEEKKSDEIFIVVDKQPEFPDGITGLMEWLNENVQYPKEAHEKGIQGRVIVSFVIEKDGSVTDVRVILGVDPLLDAEAIWVIPLMPAWEPGELNNETVRVKFTLPIVFRLSDEEKEARDAIQIRDFDTVKHETQKTDSIKMKSTSDEVFDVVEVQPEFPGGIKDLMKFIAESIVFTKETDTLEIEGKVVTGFIVHKDGSTSDITILKSLHPLLDMEIIRVLSIMPKWKPGMQNGEAVNVRYTLPVSFIGKNNDNFVVKDKELKEIKSTDSENDENEVFVIVDKQPEYPEGPRALIKFLGNNINYPVRAIENNIQGRIIVNFIIHKDGSISDINAEKKGDPMLRKEALRVVSIMPNWIPGELDGEIVNVRYFLPVDFRLGRVSTIRSR